MSGITTSTETHPERRYPPGPRTRLPGDNLRAFQSDPIGLLTRSAREGGDLSHFRIGRQDFYLLNHPDLIKDVLVTHDRYFRKAQGLRLTESILGKGLLTSEGDFHLRQRRMIQPAFHRQRIAGYAGTMVTYAARTRERWQEGETLDMHAEMMRLTLAIVGKTLFGADVESEAGEIGQALAIAMAMFKRRQSLLGPFLEKLDFLPRNRRFAQARQRLDATIYRLIDEHRAGGSDQTDLLTMLLQAQDVEGDGEGMSDRQVRDEAMTIFLAGHETTSNALTWTWYLLAQHPEVEVKLHAEIDAAIAGRLPGVEDLPGLSYTEKVLTESMRLYPPAWVVAREAKADYPSGGYLLPAKSVLMMSQYVMHHDPRYYSQPEQFMPERWTPEFKSGLPKFAYFPFGGGPRLCIGEPFAWMEGVLLIAALAQQWQFRLAPGQKIELWPQITLRPKNGVRMVLNRRRGVGMRE